MIGPPLRLQKETVAAADERVNKDTFLRGASLYPTLRGSSIQCEIRACCCCCCCCCCCWRLLLLLQQLLHLRNKQGTDCMKALQKTEK